MLHKSYTRNAHFKQIINQFLANLAPKERFTLDKVGTDSLAAWFLGPRAENEALFSELIQQAVQANVAFRKTQYPDDPPYITEERKDKEYYSAVEHLKREYEKLLDQLSQSVPFYSYRYQAHMNWDLTIPSMLGYFAAMLYNQNNVALEASPVTSELEKLVGNDLCKMLGFDTSGTASPKPWGHITCDGSVANLEALWAARNLKYYALSIKTALLQKDVLSAARSITVTLGNGENVVLVEQDTWTLINLSVDEIINLPARIQKMCGISTDIFSDAVDQYLLQTLGIETFMSRYTTMTSSEKPIKPAVIIGPATKHYSWPKNAALLGVGKEHYINIPVDENARMDITILRSQLEKCRKEFQPVLMVMAVLGSTEESAVDPLADIVALRNEYFHKKLSFVLHVDAAWGGYFASILREPSVAKATAQESNDLQETPVLKMSDYVTAQYEALPDADSITVDPHKAGYIPYAAGGLCYRNGGMRNLLAFLAPEVYHGESLDANVGIYGVEGSKPGAAAAGVYLSHHVIRPDTTGYGKILGQALFNSKRFFAAVITMAKEDDDFIVVPVQQIPAERQGGTAEQIRTQLLQIQNSIVNRQNNELILDSDAMELLRQLGSDQIIITYGLNFKTDNTLNKDTDLANCFMQDVFRKLSKQPGKAEPGLIITTSDFTIEEYGEKFINTYKTRLGLDCASGGNRMCFLSSTTMCPWLTATRDGNFIPVLINEFRNAIYDVLREYQQTWRIISGMKNKEDIFFN